MPPDPIDILRRFYAAESVYLSAGGRGDFSPMADTLAKDCVMLQPDSLPYRGCWRGHDGYRRWMDAFAEAWSSLDVREPHMNPCGEDLVFVRSTVHATARGSGHELTWPLLQMIQLRRGLIARIEPFYWDTHPLVAALGQP